MEEMEAASNIYDLLAKIYKKLIKTGSSESEALKFITESMSMAYLHLEDTSYEILKGRL